MSTDEDQLKKYSKMVTLKPKSINVLEGRSDFPVICSALEDVLRKTAARGELLLPNLNTHNKSVFAFSDYGGESHDAKFFTYSVLVCAYDPLDFFFESLTAMRQKYKLDSPQKELAFKDLGYGPIKRALPEYLRICNNLLPGMIVTVVVEKNIETLFGTVKKTTHEHVLQQLEASGYGKWNADVAEKLLRIVHLVSYLITLLTTDGQNILWMTDNDSIASNETLYENTRRLFASTLAAYSKKKYGKIGCALPLNDSQNFSNLLSIPDLVGGAIEHYLSREQKMEDLTIKEEADQILMWHTEQGISLKKYAFIFRKSENGYKTGRLVFHAKKPLDCGDIIYI
ncbi:MAG: hypothetical protein WBN22_05890 [Verrucomicrobiia bacterium]|jgi:hypothetical protein